jgi:DNA-binding PadR family transcriptional regulator
MTGSQLKRAAAEKRRRQVMEHHDLLSGLVRLHVLHHAAEQEIYGQWMIEELAHHGYRLSPGTLYPLLHKMERDGYLTSRGARDGRTVRKLYSITDKGRAGLALAKERVREFTGEAMKR